MGTSYVHRYTHVFLQIYNSNRYLTFYLSTPQQTTETNTANKYNTLDYYKWTDIDRTILKCSVRWATRTQSKLQIHWFWRTVFVKFFFLLARTRIICLIFQLDWICFALRPMRSYRLILIILQFVFYHNFSICQIYRNKIIFTITRKCLTH